jgi:hypothetical protein
MDLNLLLRLIAVTFLHTAHGHGLIRQESALLGTMRTRCSSAGTNQPNEGANEELISQPNERENHSSQLQVLNQMLHART